MEMSPVFFKIRNVAFSCIIAVSLVWTILLCVEISTRYDVSDPSQRNLVGVLIFINAVTSIMLPILLIAEFRAWLDAARLVFLLLVHVGTAALFTAWNPGFTCPNQTGDAVGVCQLINMYILLGSWVVPAMLVWYSAVLGVMFYLRSRYPVPPKMPEKRESELPMMLPSRHASTMMSAPGGLLNISVDSMPRPSWMVSSSTEAAASAAAAASSSEQDKPSFVVERTSQRSSGRLSKRLPNWVF